MKVIFIKDLKKQGRVNDIKEVSDGYATNYLIKNGYAVKYTKGSNERLQNELDIKAREEEKEIEKANKIKEKLNDVCLTFKVKCSNDGKVFGSISSKQISDKLNVSDASWTVEISGSGNDLKVSAATYTKGGLTCTYPAMTVADAPASP